MDRKGQYTIGALGSLAIVLVVASILIAVGAEVLDSVKGGLSTQTAGVLETIAAENNSVIALAGAGAYFPNKVINDSTFLVYNDSGRANVVLSGNYSVTANNYSITINATDNESWQYFPGDNLYLSYNITLLETTAYNSTREGLDGVAVFGEWLDTIALIIVAAVVIGIIATSFGRQ